MIFPHSNNDCLFVCVRSQNPITSWIAQSFIMDIVFLVVFGFLNVLIYFTFFQYYKMTVLVYMSHDIALLELCHQSYCLSFLGDVCEWDQWVWVRGWGHWIKWQGALFWVMTCWSIGGSNSQGYLSGSLQPLNSCVHSNASVYDCPATNIVLFTFLCMIVPLY